MKYTLVQSADQALVVLWAVLVVFHVLITPWLRDLIGIVAASFVAGTALVIFMLALNMTVAVGTLNGILFYANIVAVNADIYFLPSTTPNFVTVFISWLNLDIGFDACFIKTERSYTYYFNDVDNLYKQSTLR